MKTLFTLLSMAMALPAPAWAAEDFTGTKEVRLIHGDLGSPKAKTVIITDKAKIEKLLATIKLEGKVPCACDHIQHAVFVTGASEITVSLCDHCFDIGKDTYRMPPDFYKLYTAYWQAGHAEAAKPVEPVPNYTRYYIHAIGEGTLLVHSCLTPTRFAVSTDERTVVIRLDGTAGKLSDLKVGQWVKFRQEGNEEHRITMIEVVSDSIQGTIIDAPGQDGIFNVQPQGTKAPCAAMKITTDPKTVITIAEEKIKIADLKVGMWVRAEMVGGVATRIVAGHLWLEEGEKGLPEECFTHPAGFDVNNVPTKFGPLRMMYRLTGNGSYLRWGRKALPKEGMVVYWPPTLKARFSYGSPVKPDSNGLIYLPADVSELRIWFVDSIVPKRDSVQKRGVDAEVLTDPAKAATAELVVRGTLESDAAGPGRGGWPTYTMTVTQVFKTPKDVKIEVGQKLTVKTIKEFTGSVTLYLVFDKDQKLYRIQDPTGERGFSHVDGRK
jgi:hypothetical protein